MLLAIETATTEVGVAVAGPDGLLASATARPGRRHAEMLHPLLADVASRAGVGLAELESVAVDVGPGLFTGLRVGVATAKALAFALELPIVEAMSTEILLHATRWRRGPVAAVVDLRRGELAWVLAEDPTLDGAEAGAHPPIVGTPEELAKALSASPAPVLLVGDGARRHGKLLVELVAASGGAEPVLCGDELAAPPVASLATLAVGRLVAGRVRDAYAVTPRYLREADVRINWVTRDDEAPLVAGERG